MAVPGKEYKAIGFGGCTLMGRGGEAGSVPSRLRPPGAAGYPPDTLRSPSRGTRTDLADKRP